MAKTLIEQGVVVAGFSTPAFLKALEADKDKCMNPNCALTALAQDVEHKVGRDPSAVADAVLGGLRI